MPELISEPTMIPVPGGKSIAEYIGRVKTGDNDVSIAVMHAPAGWSEPAQAPTFDEFTKHSKKLIKFIDRNKPKAEKDLRMAKLRFLYGYRPQDREQHVKAARERSKAL
jgi:hypothetical protein